MNLVAEPLSLVTLSLLKSDVEIDFEVHSYDSLQTLKHSPRRKKSQLENLVDTGIQYKLHEFCSM